MKHDQASIIKKKGDSLKAKQCLLYAKDRFKTISDAWSHTIHLLSYPCYNPSDYKPKTYQEEMQELYEEYRKYGFIYEDEKGNLRFSTTSIEEGLKIIG